MKKNSQKRKIHRIVLTGGPCSGKTTALAILSQKLREVGYRVFIVPEVATTLISGGVIINELQQDPKAWEVFQETILRSQFDIEKRFLKLAKIHKGEIVIIYDRGIMDAMAYLEKARFISILKRTGNTISQARDSRYDAVIHLVTAANGAESFYNLDNPARSEDIVKARVLDRKTMEAWVGHEHLMVIDNGVIGALIDFETKMHHLVGAVFEILGIPQPIERENKYLLEASQKPPKGSIGFEIVQTYLNSSNPLIERRVRRRNQLGEDFPIFTYAEKIPVSKDNNITGPKERIELERLIPKREYDARLLDRDQNREDIIKTRYFFIWEHQYFQMDFISHPVSLVLLEIELTKSQSSPKLPPHIKVVRDVTNDREFSNSSIARRLSI